MNAIGIECRVETGIKKGESKRTNLTMGSTATTIFPTQIHDAKAAIRWLRAKADEFQIDPKRIGVTGRSAGGQLSLLLGLTDPNAKLEGDGGNLDQSSRVQAVVNVFGPTDMAKCYQTSSLGWVFRLVVGGTPEEHLR